MFKNDELYLLNLLPTLEFNIHQIIFPNEDVTANPLRNSLADIGNGEMDVNCRKNMPGYWIGITFRRYGPTS